MLKKKILFLAIYLVLGHPLIAQELVSSHGINMTLIKTIPTTGQIYSMDIVSEPTAIIKGKNVHFFARLSEYTFTFFDENGQPIAEKKIDLHERISISDNGKFVFIWNNHTGRGRLETLEGKILWEKEITGRMAGPLNVRNGEPKVTTDGRVSIPLTGRNYTLMNETPFMFTYNYNEADQLQLYDQLGNSRNFGSLRDGQVKPCHFSAGLSADGNYYGLACRISNPDSTEEVIIALYDMRNLTELWTKRFDGEEVSGEGARVVVSQDGHLACILVNNGMATAKTKNLYIFSNDGAMILNKVIGDGECGGIRGASLDGKYVALSGCEENQWSFHVFEVVSGKPLWKYSSGIVGGFSLASLSNNAKLTIVSQTGPDGSVTLIFNNKGEIVREFAGRRLRIVSDDGQNIWLSEKSSILNFRVDYNK